MDNGSFGQLYIVSTPIGNLQDMTFRSVETLANVDLIACEDTRETIKILNHFNIKNKLISYHEHNKYDKLDYLINELKSGKNIAIVTDQGTPIISDPGYELVREVLNQNIKVTAIPGACALINAVVLSGLDSREFVFVGFLSKDKKEKKDKLKSLKNETRTMVFYLSPHKLLNTLNDMVESFGENRNATLLREMTKKYEEINTGTLKNIYDLYESREIKGEFVIVIEGTKEVNNIDKYEKLTLEEIYDILLKESENEKEALKKLAEIKNIKKKDLYKLLKT